ncbi:MAG: long-chain fatty acid--CoA ligase [Proteobacteria bacterium]|nr:long-chain fatty acid--CoA ligase [Pseudomonadota bacterium]
MGTQHFKFWPQSAQRHLEPPQTNLFCNLEVSARRRPAKPALVYYDSIVSYAQLLDEAQRVAAFLQQRCAVARGERVLLFMQNSPQFVVGYYGILRADAVVVPVNTMYLTQEFARTAGDAGAVTAIVSQELYPRIEPLLASGQLRHVIIAAYSDYLTSPTSLAVPDFVSQPRTEHRRPGLFLWREVLDAGLTPGALTAGSEELCVMPYTSGTTGQPKGCMHTHATTMYTSVAQLQWFGATAELTLLAVAPMFHVTGMQGAMNGPLYVGCTIVIMPRWDRTVAAECVQRYGIATWTGVPTMFQDFFANPDIGKYDLSSITKLSGGGAAMPAAVAQRLLERGISFCEGYGLTETMAATHINPLHHPKPQCLGIPIYGVDSRVVDPQTLREMSPGEVGEIVTHGPQLFKGYWNKPADTAEVFVQIDGKRFFRTGDLGRVDEDGYFFMVDRLKRMINASGFKVWPTEVEALMYQHPGVLEACVIGTRDAHRGETVKALVVLRPEWRERVTAQELREWCHQNMAAYKAPRVVVFTDSLPKSGSGKIMWRELQERESAAGAAEATH